MRSLLAALAGCLVLAPGALGATGSGGVAADGGVVPVQPPVQPPVPPGPVSPPVVPVPAARLTNGMAHPAPRTPVAVRRVIAAANQLQLKPYRYGGGHASFIDTAYDCSGTVSFALHGAALVAAPLDSTGLASWGLPGAGSWITVYANKGHAFMVVAGLRLDTSGSGGAGPRWRIDQRSTVGFTARHPAGL